MKVAYNNRYGGFDLSDKAIEYIKNKGFQNYFIFIEHRLQRHNPILIEAIELLGTDANGKYAFIKIAEIPDEYENFYKILEYDGLESVYCDFKALIKYKLENTKKDDHTLLDEIKFLVNQQTYFGSNIFFSNE